MKRSLFFPLISKLGKIYFSNISSKEIEYKKVVFYMLKNMGGVYIKFLQAICVTQKFMEGWGGPQEFEVFHQVKRESINIFDCIPNKEAFSYIEETPFACGSFAQLYKAELKTGEVVALKILRPSIFRTLKSDLKKLKTIVKIMNWFLPNSLIDYNAAFEEFRNHCLLETDYEREICNMEYFYQLYDEYDHIMIPKVYRNLSNQYMIVQQWIEGPTLADLMCSVKKGESLYEKNLELTGSNIWAQLVLVGGELLRSAMMEDYVFGDPHPGNIILLKDNKIALIDFGLIAPKPTSQKAFYLWVQSYYDLLTGKNNLGEMLQSSFRCFCPDLAIALERSSTLSSNDFVGSIAAALDQKMKSMHNQNAKALLEEGHLFKLFVEFLDSKNALILKVDMRNFQLLKACQAFLCTVVTIDSRFGNKQFSSLMLSCIEYAFSYCDEMSVQNDMPRKSKYTANESYELLVDMFSSLADGDEFLFHHISERMFL